MCRTIEFMGNISRGASHVWVYCVTTKFEKKRKKSRVLFCYHTFVNAGDKQNICYILVGYCENSARPRKVGKHCSVAQETKFV